MRDATFAFVSGTPLMDEQTFARQLYQGLGRPNLHLRRHDAAPYHDALLHACIANPVYDRQCTGSRADYLFELLQLTGELPAFERRILGALADPGEDADIDQLFDFVRIFAQQGSREARELMYAACATSIRAGDNEGVDQVVALDGVDGFLFVVGQFDQHTPAEPTDPPDEAPIRTLQRTLGDAESERVLAGLRESYAVVARYLAAVEAAQQRWNQAAKQRRLLSKAPYSELKQTIQEAHKGLVRLPLKQWGMHATESDLRAAAADLLLQTEPKHLIRYLQVFLGRPFPLPWEHLRPLAYHEHERVARLAILCLEQLEHPGIRSFAFDLIAANHYAGNAVGLFAENYRAGDERFFAELLERTDDVDELHTIGMNLRDVYEANEPLAAAPLLLELYERGPCSLCRTGFVDLLIEARRVPAWLAEESAYDAEPETRKSIDAYLHDEGTS
jgi:hypothetical protein